MIDFALNHPDILFGGIILTVGLAVLAAGGESKTPPPTYNPIVWVIVSIVALIWVAAAIWAWTELVG